MIEAARAGYGLIQVPDCYAHPYIERGELVETLRDYKAGGYEISAVYLQRQRLAPRLRVFKNFLVRLFNPPPWSAQATGALSGSVSTL